MHKWQTIPTILREIRATLERFDEMDKRFDQLDKRFEDFHALVNRTLGLSTTNYLRSREFEQRHEFSEGHQRRIDERMAEVERRLTKVESKLDD